MKKVLFIFGTRPEAIKLAPLIKELEKYPQDFKVIIGLTAQHRQMLDSVLEFFKIKPDYDLNLMRPNQSLFNITVDSLRGLEKVVNLETPDLVVVQGDTTTALVGALAAYYKKIPVVHIEAGLRSYDKYSPFPEEINRKLISKISDYNFTPTVLATKNLYREGIKNNTWRVGNTVIDALKIGLKIIQKNKSYPHYNFKDIDFSKHLVLVTGHRRENFGQPLKDICQALSDIAKKFPAIEIVYPVHLNPNVKEVVYEILGKIRNIHLLPPLDYPDLIWLMEKSYLIITDSGGIQEEAPALGKPLLVTRELTERPEGIKFKTAKLVGSNRRKIVRLASELLIDKKAYLKMSKAVNPYGDGKSCQRIVKILKKIK